VLKAIEEINQRKADNFLVGSKRQNAFIGIDSLAYFLKAKIETLSPVLQEMEQFDIIEFEPKKELHNGGQAVLRKFRLKE
jgi:hypothetical protein